ncbi:MAG: sugar ABC transporter ATP-binding protein [Clostridia bacterium]|nr:sugar ABC transporter ATP-binding protein [Clostridia bacterium]
MSGMQPADLPPARLELKNLCVEVSDTFRLEGIHLALVPGHVHILMGENGSGKSSLIHTIAGNLMACGGQILFDGQVVQFNSPADAKALGIATAYQNANLFHNLTVAENIYVERLPRQSSGLKAIDWARLYADTDRLLARLGFDIPAHKRVGQLNVAECHLVEIAKAYVAGAKVIIFDEPTAALTDREVAILFGMIREFQQSGAAVLYVTHRMNELRQIGDELTILRDGKVTYSGNVHDLDSTQIVHEMSGLSFRERYPKLKIALGEEVLRVENLSFQSVLKNIQFSLHQREILGITGLVGSGRTMIAKCIYGAMRPDSLKLFLNGKPVRFRSPADAINHGIGYVSEDRYLEGLFPHASIPFNITSPDFALAEATPVINRAKESLTAHKFVQKLLIHTRSIFSRIAELSGGNQQKVLLAKWIYSRSDILILDEPTRGIDVASKVDLYNILNEMLRRDVSIILVSSDIDEIVGLCDRILVLYGGEIAAIIPREHATREQVMFYSTGGHRN